MSQERLDATVYGRVQGVGFRYHVVMRAMETRADRLGRERS